MKKLIMMISIMFMMVVSFAQVNNGFVSLTPDSTLNAETIYLTLDAPIPLSKNYVVTLSLVPVNTSGTATVVATPQGSSDNLVWFDLQSAGDTVNNAGTVALTAHEFANANWLYYREKLVSTGTGVTHFTGELGIKRK